MFAVYILNISLHARSAHFENEPSCEINEIHIEDMLIREIKRFVSTGVYGSLMFTLLPPMSTQFDIRLDRQCRLQSISKGLLF